MKAEKVNEKNKKKKNEEEKKEEKKKKKKEKKKKEEMTHQFHLTCQNGPCSPIICMLCPITDSGLVGTFTLTP